MSVRSVPVKLDLSELTIATFRPKWFLISPALIACGACSPMIWESSVDIQHDWLLHPEGVYFNTRLIPISKGLEVLALGSQNARFRVTARHTSKLNMRMARLAKARQTVIALKLTPKDRPRITSSSRSPQSSRQSKCGNSMSRWRSVFCYSYCKVVSVLIMHLLYLSFCQPPSIFSSIRGRHHDQTCATKAAAQYVYRFHNL